MLDAGIKIDSALLRQIFAYWDSRRQGRPFPRRADIDPIHIPRLLPHVFLVDVQRDGCVRFRIRVSGSYLEAAFQQFGAGRYVDEYKLNGEIDDILARYSECAETGRPVLSRHVFVNEDSRRFDYERLLLPIAVDRPDRVDMIFGGMCFTAPLPTPRLLAGAARASMERRVPA